ncbi:hypothetical protein H8R23_15425 [Flavobacterium sp. F-380]|uniref:Uncharacterized protein n=1 Tax=Flavobacterium kayseriense TaxID=2764714 RepID=A0ABR7JBA2_9FLAO|nr:hypothetical protein [Flavobacterium kayseriense]MBC5842804.1 hypothetical protein [Flavobacterium kayseriense]MBC5849334.1 hypothetical protein [Flavobacterium kayseriense]
MTAEYFLLNEVIAINYKQPAPKQVEQWMIEFAKMHVTKALKKASENTKTGVTDSCGDIRSDLVEQNILNSYSLDNIK